MKRAILVVILLVSVALLAASYLKTIPTKPIEAIGFVTGLVGVYLVVLENPWNWPIGVVSSGFYAVVFLQSRLFGDSALNVLYVILGLLGWYWWLRGGRSKPAEPPADPPVVGYPRESTEPPRNPRELRISSLDARGWAVSLVALVAMTTGFYYYFVSIKDAAPFLDALTTALSLVAQILLTRKALENWIFWIVADVIYVPLYWSRDLRATAVLYVLFLALATGGFLEWRRKHRVNPLEPIHA